MDYRTVSHHMCLKSSLSVHKQLVILVDACNIESDCQARTATHNYHFNKCLWPADLTEPVNRKPIAEQNKLFAIATTGMYMYN